MPYVSKSRQGSRVTLKLHDLEGWRWLWKTEKGDRPCINRLRRMWCRWRGHQPGVVWFNASGSEPDMHCRHCGDDLG